ncbi:MAG: CCA tRNA nucleotidyltransferase [Bacteriovoracia bacterium]
MKLIRTKLDLPLSVLDAWRKLRENGYTALIAGGCIRDHLLGRLPRDYDLATTAPLEKIAQLFPKHVDVGMKFGVVKLVNKEDFGIDVAIFRKDGVYSDRRHPDSIDIGDPKSDALRRDFTVNALFYDPDQEEIHDYVDGYKDFEQRLIRCVGEPETRFSEDALRILRAARFTAQLNFKLDKDTSVAMKKCSSYLEEISRERIREELFKLLESQKPVVGIESLAIHGMWNAIFGIKKTTVPADLRHFKLNWSPSPIQWLCFLRVIGLIGDPTDLKHNDVLVDKLRLTNEEKHFLSLCSRVYDDAEQATDYRSKKDEKNRVIPKISPLGWVELARQDRRFIDTLRSFVRRARGVDWKQKENAMEFLLQATRWEKIDEKAWPKNAKDLSKKVEPGPKMGQLLRDAQWSLFWKKPASFSKEHQS